MSAVEELEADVKALEGRIYRMGEATRSILDGCRRAAFCPFCGRDGEIDPGDGLGCCVIAGMFGYWDDDGFWRLRDEVLS